MAPQAREPRAGLVGDDSIAGIRKVIAAIRYRPYEMVCYLDANPPSAVRGIATNPKSGLVGGGGIVVEPKAFSPQVRTVPYGTPPSSAFTTSGGRERHGPKITKGLD